jgi:hypothetical protein
MVTAVAPGQCPLPRLLKQGCWLLLLGLATAGSVAAAAEVASGDQASFEARNDTDRPIFLYAYKNWADCSGGIVKLGKKKMVRNGESVAISLEPGTPFSFFANYHFMDAGRIKYCNMPATFTPEANARYRVSFEAGLAACRFNVTKEVDGIISDEETFRLREWLQPFTSRGAFCKVEP